MALTLSQDDLDAIEALNPHNYEGGFDPEDEPVVSFEIRPLRTRSKMGLCVLTT
jgi:hypothetical protein